MSVFAIADLHLSMSEAVDKPMDIYGGPWVGHANRLKEYWGAIVSEKDTVIIPGDISWALYLEDAMADLAWIDALPGKKVLVRGNHDLWWSSMAKMRGHFESISFIQNDAYDGGDFIVFGSRGWICPGDKLFDPEVDKKIYDRECIRLKLSADCAASLAEKAASRGKYPVIIGAMHYPPTNDRREASGFTEIFSAVGALKVVYGHLHGDRALMNGPSGLIGGAEYINVALDKLYCLPLRIL